MAQTIVRHVLLTLRVLIIAGALASVVQPRVSYRLTNLALISFHDRTTRVMPVDPGTMVRLALTAMSLSLL